jgi:hypothetical protein
MDETYGCAEVRPLLVELATGVLTGHERGQALRHVAGCAACRQELAELSQVADSLLLLAPRMEPPAGFESAVMARIVDEGARPGEAHEAAAGQPASVGQPEPAGQPASVGQPEPAGQPAPARPRSARWRRWLTRPALAAAVAVLVAGGLGAWTVQWRTAEDRAVAAKYRETLAIADGRYLRAMQMTTEAGARAGTVFLYQGRPSWLLVTVTAAPADGAYTMAVVDRDGVRHPLGVCPVAGGRGTAGYALDVAVANVAVVQLRGPGGELLAARV